MLICIGKLCKKDPVEATSLIAIKERIIGGSPVSLKNARFFAGIILRKGDYSDNGLSDALKGDVYICGSTIIGKFWSITAAHCFDSLVQRVSRMSWSYVCKILLLQPILSHAKK